jgi:glycosyltransferase involved in cell wall biosynthesis
MAVVITENGDGSAAARSVSSIREAETVEIVIVSAGSSEPSLGNERRGLHPDEVRLVAEPRGGIAGARRAGLAASSAPFVLLLKAGDVVVRAALGPLADLLEREPLAGVAYGDFAEVRRGIHLRRAPARLEEFRALPESRRPPAVLFRRGVLENPGASAAADPLGEVALWRSLAERGIRGSRLEDIRATCIRTGPSIMAAPIRGPRLLLGSSYRPLGPGEREQLWLVLRASRDRLGERPATTIEPRVAVLIPCFNDGRFVGGAVDSIEEDEPVEIVVVDDRSTDGETLRVLNALDREGVRVVRPEAHGGLAAARNFALERTAAPYVFPLDADDFAVPGALARMADILDDDEGIGVCYGDIEEVSAVSHIAREVPEGIDPFRLAYANEMPLGAMYRRALIVELGGWTDPDREVPGYEDWDLWMSLAEQGVRTRHLGTIGYRYRIQANRLTASTRRSHPRLYRALRERHPALFEHLPEHRSSSDLGQMRKLLYPVVYGGRRRVPIERPIKRTLDRFGIWTRRRR